MGAKKQQLLKRLEDLGFEPAEAETWINEIVAEASNPEGMWPPMPPVGDFVQLEDGGVFNHVEWGDFRAVGSGMAFPWTTIGRRVIAHGTIHWRNPFGGTN